jgi:hypothetical protein
MRGEALVFPAVFAEINNSARNKNSDKEQEI